MNDETLLLPRDALLDCESQSRLQSLLPPLIPLLRIGEWILGRAMRHINGSGKLTFYSMLFPSVPKPIGMFGLKRLVGGGDDDETRRELVGDQVYG